MIKCNLCGVQKETGRQMHGHMMKMHPNEYKETGFDMQKLTEGYRKKNASAEQNRPYHLRLLNKNDAAELDCINDGYLYYDPDVDVAYTADEAKKKGWIK